MEESSYEDYSEEGEIDLDDRAIYENANYADSKSSQGVPQVRTFKTGSDSFFSNTSSQKVKVPVDTEYSITTNRTNQSLSKIKSSDETELTLHRTPGIYSKNGTWVGSLENISAQLQGESTLLTPSITNHPENMDRGKIAGSGTTGSLIIGSGQAGVDDKTPGPLLF